MLAVLPDPAAELLQVQPTTKPEASVAIRRKLRKRAYAAGHIESELDGADPRSDLVEPLMNSTDPRAVQFAESRYRNGYGPTVAESWDELRPSTRQLLVSEAESWLGAAIAAGLMPPAAPTAEDLAAADDPTHLRWGLDDVLWGDDDTVIVLMSDEERRPYWLELDSGRATVLRRNLAGPDREPADEKNGRRPCGHDDYHGPHEWRDRPGVWCPGIGTD